MTKKTITKKLPPKKPAKKPAKKPTTKSVKKPVAKKKAASSKVEAKQKKGNSSHFKKGMTKTGGRKKGKENVITVELKSSIMEAFAELGGVEYLITMGLKRPELFCSLLGKILPAEIKATMEHTGDVTYIVHTGASNRPPIGVNNPKLKLIGEDVSHSR